MTRLNPPGERRCSGDDQQLGDEYQSWDAAYVLGALSPADRRSFESHLGTCPFCQDAVAELGGMPALLSQLDPEVVAGLDPTDDGLNAADAAAAALAIGGFIGIGGHWSPTAPPPPSTVATLPMAQVHTALLSSTVSVSDENWGTLIRLQCVCLADSNAPHDTLALVVVGRDGSRSQLASWVARPGHTATPAGSTAMPADQIGSVQVVAADSGEVLLQRTL